MLSPLAPMVTASYTCGCSLSHVWLQVGPGVTHVVAGRAGTDKAKWARSQPGVHAVSLEWLAACGYQWRRCDERAFQVQAAAAAVKPEHLVGVGSSQLAPPQLDA